MKQFVCSSTDSLPYRIDEVASAAFANLIVRGRVAGSDVIRMFDKLLVGESLLDEDGDVWTRLPDLIEEPAPAVETRLATDVQAERLERIATAALQGLITGVTSSPELGAMHSQGAKDRGFTFEQYLAMDAVRMAKALIAELDRQS